MKIIVEDTAGNRYETEVSSATQLSTLAVDFFEQMGWPMTDDHGRKQRAVVELVNPDDPDLATRLQGDHNLEEAQVQEGDILRIFPEAIAGAQVTQRERLRALIADHHDMRALAEKNSRIKFEANTTHAPTVYKIELNFPGFGSLGGDAEDPKPIRRDHHQVEITLGANYPRDAPFVRWITPIFHPNIRESDGAVCLGVLMDRYRPALGLARIVIMLTEMVQYKNFDMSNALNGKAAEWAANPKNWPEISKIGGSYLQGPVEEFLEKLKKKSNKGKERPRISFNKLTQKKH